MPANPAEYNQSSFIGGMNLLGDDSRLSPNQYRIGFNITNRFDELDLIPSSIEDTAVPKGIKQALVTFGNYLVVFVDGMAFWKYYNQVTWNVIEGFNMSPIAPKYWTAAVPVSTTNYLRTSILAITGPIVPNPAGGINFNAVAGLAGGNLPGLLVQDNINQPQFIYIGIDGFPTCRITQTFAQWSITFTDGTGVTAVSDNREYVPIGNCMAWNNGILYIVSQDFNTIYRSVQGRPLDFMVNVTNALPIVGTVPPYTLFGGGPATTTSTSVGVGGISCIRPISSGGIFVSASGYNASLIPNMTPNAPTIFGEYTFIITALFNAFCLSERAIIDTIGDTRFIELTGIRSFNAVEQFQNEGRNSPFSAPIQPIFYQQQTQPNTVVVQDTLNSAAVLFDNYELYSVDTILGSAICKYDTINSCWVGLDIQQLKGKRAKQFAAMQTNVLALFAITEDNKLYQLYASLTDEDTGVFRSVGVCATLLYANYNIKMNNPKTLVKLIDTRVIVNKQTEDNTVTCNAFIDNREYARGVMSKDLSYDTPEEPYNDGYTLPDVNTQLTNLFFKTPDMEQGWKVFCQYSWTNGVITQYSMELTTITPENPLKTQGITT